MSDAKPTAIPGVVIVDRCQQLRPIVAGKSLRWQCMLEANHRGSCSRDPSADTHAVPGPLRIMVRRG